MKKNEILGRRKDNKRTVLREPENGDLFKFLKIIGGREARKPE